MYTKQIMLITMLAGALFPAAHGLAARAAGQEGAPARAAGPGPANLPTLERMFVAGNAMRKPVKNAPYIAETINETQQTLLDGNQIVNKHSTMSYRDSAGRTRQEVLNP